MIERRWVVWGGMKGRPVLSIFYFLFTWDFFFLLSSMTIGYFPLENNKKRTWLWFVLIVWQNPKIARIIGGQIVKNHKSKDHSLNKIAFIFSHLGSHSYTHSQNPVNPNRDLTFFICFLIPPKDFHQRLVSLSLNALVLFLFFLLLDGFLLLVWIALHDGFKNWGLIHSCKKCMSWQPFFFQIKTDFFFLGWNWFFLFGN